MHKSQNIQVLEYYHTINHGNSALKIIDMLDFKCAHLLTKAKGKSRHEVLKQKVEFSFQNSGI